MSLGSRTCQGTVEHLIIAAEQLRGAAECVKRAVEHVSVAEELR